MEEKMQVKETAIVIEIITDTETLEVSAYPSSTDAINAMLEAEKKMQELEAGYRNRFVKTETNEEKGKLALETACAEADIMKDAIIKSLGWVDRNRINGNLDRIPLKDLKKVFRAIASAVSDEVVAYYSEGKVDA